MSSEEIGYQKEYTMRIQGGGIITSVPKDVIRRAANKRNMEIEEFIEKFKIQAEFDDYKDCDLRYSFVERGASESEV